MTEKRKKTDRTTADKLRCIKEFLKSAWKVDGRCEYVRKPKLFCTYFALHDSKRGVIIVGLGATEKIKRGEK